MNLFNNISVVALNVAEEVKVPQNVIFDISRLPGTLKHMGIGMFSIFVVIGVIILSVYGLNKMTDKIEEIKAKREQNK